MRVSMLGRFAVIGYLSLLGIVVMPESAAATVWVPVSPTPADLNNLGHFEFYSWRIDFASNRTASVEQTDSATPAFKPLYNWDLDAKMLFLRLANTATYSGVRTLTDDNAEPTRNAEKLDESPLLDDYPSFSLNNILLTRRFFVRSTGPTLVESPGWSVAADREEDDLRPIGSAKEQAFSYTYTFAEMPSGLTESQISELQEPILEGDVALLVDPDFAFNDKITLQIRGSRRHRSRRSVPEPAGLVLLGLGLVAGAGLLQRKRSKKENPALA